MPTKIEWCEETWNPITGCTPISEGCQNCYAKRMANRLRGRYGYSEIEPFQITRHHKSYFYPPMQNWGKPRIIFVCSMGDLWHKQVPQHWIDGVLDKARRYSQHTYLFLTKRPERIRFWAFPNNAWVGVTIEHQKYLQERMNYLYSCRANIKFISAEPMLSNIDISEHEGIFDWVICGAETGPGARYMEPKWAENLYEQCQKAGVPFFFKKASKGDTLDLPREYPNPCQRPGNE